MRSIMAGDAGRYGGRVRVIKGDSWHKEIGVVASAAGVVAGRVGCALALGHDRVVAGKAIGGSGESAVIGLGTGHPSCGRVANAAVIAAWIFAAGDCNMSGGAHHSIGLACIMAGCARRGRRDHGRVVEVRGDKGRRRMTIAACVKGGRVRRSFQVSQSLGTGHNAHILPIMTFDAGGCVHNCVCVAEGPHLKVGHTGVADGAVG